MLSKLPGSASGSSGLQEESDESLLIFMALRDEDPDLAKRSWMEFYGRHVKYVNHVCTRLVRAIGCFEPVDLVQETFARVWQHAVTFKAEGLEGDQLQKRVRIWLGQIAKNCFRTWSHEENRVPIERVKLSELGNFLVVPEVPADSNLLRHVRNAINSLSEREQHVIRVTFAFHQRGKDHQRLSNSDSAELAAALRTTSENIRQIRSRALKKI